MPKNEGDAARLAQSRLQNFLDCVARLLARRWVQEEREKGDDIPEQSKETGEEIRRP